VVINEHEHEDIIYDDLDDSIENEQDEQADKVEEKNGAYTLKNNWERIIEQDGNIDLIVFKAKRGTGMTGKIPLKLDKAKMTVSDRIDENRSKFDSATVITPQSKLFGSRGI